MRLKLANEIRALRLLHKENQDGMVAPHIVKLFDVYDEEKHRILILEYLSGKNMLRQLFKCVIPEANIRQIIFNLILSIQFMHKRKILHRDICLENLVVS